VLSEQSPTAITASATAGSTNQVGLDHSSFGATSTGGAGPVVVSGHDVSSNQDADVTPPLFRDAAAGDFAQDAGSPTVNAGLAFGGVGPFDFEGDPRPQGTAPDIGADEVDLIAPITTLGARPIDPTSLRTAIFGFHADDPFATFRCKLDSKPYAACTSPVQYRHLKRGKHTFKVRATDPSGNKGAAVSYDWRVKR
jgi:hypothetical protein